MPNGKQAYRIAPTFYSPSPPHTSDSEETLMQKRRYRMITLKVKWKWKKFVARRRAQRNYEALTKTKMLPEFLLVEAVLRLICQYV